MRSACSTVVCVRGLNHLALTTADSVAGNTLNQMIRGKKFAVTSEMEEKVIKTTAQI